MDPVTPKTKAILYVEDHRDTAEMVALILSDYDVRIAADYNEAVNLIDEHQFSVVLLDYNLGGGRTGLDFCRHVRAGGHAMPVFVTTANDALEEDVIRNAGAQGVIRKNSDFIARLTALIESLMSNSQVPHTSNE